MKLLKRLLTKKSTTVTTFEGEALRALLDQEAPHSDRYFIYVKIPEQIGPLDRGEKYEDPLQEMLEAEGIGEVSGGGTMLSAPDENGEKHILFCGVDVDLIDLDRGITFLREAMRKLGAPDGTVLEFLIDGEPHEVPIYDQA